MSFNEQSLPCLTNIELCIHTFKTLGILNRQQKRPSFKKTINSTKYKKLRINMPGKAKQSRQMVAYNLSLEHTNMK